MAKMTREGNRFNAITLAYLLCLSFFILQNVQSQEIVPGRDMNRIIQNETDFWLRWWNDDSVKRIWGCGYCRKGDLACSLGSSIAVLNDQACGWIFKPADYYGYLDLDDRRAKVNPAFLRYDDVYDTKGDVESGIPDIAIVEESVESIESEVYAYWINESRWLFPNYWMHIKPTMPDGSGMDWQVWLMPCAENGGNIEYVCEWTSCIEYLMGDGSCPCPACPGDCPDPAVPPINCALADCGVVAGCDGDPGGCCPGLCTNPAAPIITCNEPQCNAKYAVPHPLADCGPTTLPGTNPGEFCCWNCHPKDTSDGSSPAGWCGLGGAVVEGDHERTEMLTYWFNGTFNMTSEIAPISLYERYGGYPHFKTVDGVDLNDDILFYNITDGIWYFPGGQYHPRVLEDRDLVRDRFWKHNATNWAFEGSRPGYCAWEGYLVPGPYQIGCMQGSGGVGPIRIVSDDFRRPASQQHDPCAPCMGFDYEYDHDWSTNNVYCRDECFNLDIRYFRHFNLDSVWVNTFKIVPEVNMMITQDELLPDFKPVCLETRPGEPRCNLGNVHDTCADTSTCIEGLICKFDWKVTGAVKRCCPEGTYNYAGCCRETESQFCTDTLYPCPKEEIALLTVGIGEGGCINDDNCSKYRELRDPSILISQHCSAGGW